MKYIISILLSVAIVLSGCGKPKDGLNGQQGPSGVQGSPGATGPVGQSGAMGLPGTNASLTTIVQFCPSQGSTVYPNNFPEVGECLGGNIYAVYYDGHNAWLAEIVPGTYISTATGLQCTFTVLSNCQIQ